MKNSIILLFIILGCLIETPIYSQDIFPIDKETGEIVYSGVVNVDSTNSKELYVRAHEWFANTFKSAKDVIQLDDKEAGKIVGKGFYDAGIPKSYGGIIHSPLIGSVNFTVEIQTKDGKYKYVFTIFSWQDIDLKSASIRRDVLVQKSLDKDWLEIKKDVNARMLAIIDGLKKSMSTNSDNW
jgi:hypothetical protein